MKRALIVLFFLVYSALSYSGTAQEKRQALIGIVDEELSELTRLTKHTKDKNPNHIFRMAELFLEKARLLKDGENEKFLSMPVKERANADKEKIFSGSRSYFVKAQQACEILLTKYDRFDKKADVFYILAFNAKEFSDERSAKKYLAAAEKIAKKDSAIAIRAKIALAEMYYNQGGYREAIPLYEESLDLSKDKWWTKDSYNLAWCYVRTKQYSKAIEKLLAVHKLSQDSKYIDMSSFTKRDMAYFYTQAGMVNEAVQFYKENRIDIAENLVKVSRLLVDQGKSAEAETVLIEALKYKTSTTQEAEINISLLVMYEKFGRMEGHLKTSKALLPLYRSGALDSDQKESYRYQVQKMASLLQKQVVDKIYDAHPDEKRRRSEIAVSYFDILANVDTTKNYEHHFFAAETYYSNEDYEKAMKYYSLAHEEIKAKNDPKMKAKILNGMFAVSGKLKGSAQEESLVSTYMLYLETHPNDEKANTIYQRLFTNYYDKKDIKKSEETLIRYKKAFPNELKTQEAMLAKIMDYYKDKNDKAGIRSWVKRINEKEFVIGAEYSKKLRSLLLGMQFDDVEKASSVGDKKKALKGYLDIFKAPESSEEAKKNASYNISVLFHELGDFERSFLWNMKAIPLMKQEEVLRFEKNLLAIGGDYFNGQYFSQAISFYALLFEKTCGSKSKNEKIFFKNGVVVALAEKDFKKVEILIERASKCNVPLSDLNETKLDLLSALVEEEKWDSALRWIDALSGSSELAPSLIKPSYKLMMALNRTGRKTEANKFKSKIVEFYQKSKKAKLDLPLDALDIVSSFEMQSLLDAQKRLENVQLAFPEDKYNLLLKKKFELLDKLTAEAIELMEIRSGRGVVKAYKIMIAAYEDMAKEIKNFTPPSDKSNEYTDSFKKGMAKIAAPISQKAAEFKLEAQKRIYKNNILSKDNAWFTGKVELPFSVLHHSMHNGVLMDRGGTD